MFSIKLLDAFRGFKFLGQFLLLLLLTWFLLFDRDKVDASIDLHWLPDLLTNLFLQLAFVLIKEL